MRKCFDVNNKLAQSRPASPRVSSYYGEPAPKCVRKWKRRGEKLYKDRNRFLSSLLLWEWAVIYTTDTK